MLGSGDTLATTRCRWWHRAPRRSPALPEDPTDCFSIVIPETITGNSDTADYKDTVLADIAGSISISNCGSITIEKETEGGTGPSRSPVSWVD
jgi:hypothetical protein